MPEHSIQFPEAYYSTLTQEEVQEVAVALENKFKDSDENYDSAFENISHITSMIIHDNIIKKPIHKDIKLNRLYSASSWSKNKKWLYNELINLSDERYAEACCTIALSKKGSLPKDISEKLGMMIRDLINLNDIQASEPS